VLARRTRGAGTHLHRDLRDAQPGACRDDERLDGVAEVLGGIVDREELDRSPVRRDSERASSRIASLRGPRTS
jgi:hypothetical protein